MIADLARTGRRTAALGMFLLGAGVASSAAIGQEQPSDPALSVELNKMEGHGDSGCRLSFVFRNQTNEEFESFKLDLVMFGHDDVIARRLIVDASPLRPEKTTVKLFDVDGLGCTEIATVLVNDLPACVVSGEARSDCIEMLSLGSRASASLMK